MAQAALALSTHTIQLASEINFDGWRDAARQLVLANIEPSDVAWVVPTASEPPSPALRVTSPPLRRGGETRFGNANAHKLGFLAPAKRGRGVERSETERRSHPTNLLIPRSFIEATQTAILHSDPTRFAFLYRLLWRLRAEPNLMHIASDPDIRRLDSMQKAVRRDIHKMRAFVRFREVDERYFSWFEPSHFIVERNADFFVRRFTGMRWSILTPYRSAHWDGTNLTFGPGAAKSDVPSEDATEDLWRTYYRNIFNPARLKVKAMQAEMPKKYWRNLPEASLIPELIAGAETSAQAMVDRSPTLPAPHHDRIQARHWPAKPTEYEPSRPAQTLSELAGQASSCRRCPLWREATQTIFGEGPENAEVVFVGEQPGDHEDIQGKPFVGPAGKVFDDAIEQAEINREKTYVTNAVKHFKFEPRGKRRIHAKPNAGEVSACRWWLDHELNLIKPKLVVALGATAAQSLLGRSVQITKMRGQVVEREDGLRVFLTIHPSFILRIPEEIDKLAERARFLADMRAVKALMSRTDSGL